MPKLAFEHTFFVNVICVKCGCTLSSIVCVILTFCSIQVGNLIGYYEFKLPDRGIGEDKPSVKHLTNVYVDENKLLTQALQNEPNVSQFHGIFEM